MVWLAHCSRSPQIAAAARLIGLAWIFALQIWLLVDAQWRILVFALVDAALAVAFLRMTRGRIFPAPLFALHAALIAYHAYTFLLGPSPYWVQVFLNRALEAALAYIAACAAFRIRNRRAVKARR